MAYFENNRGRGFTLKIDAIDLNDVRDDRDVILTDVAGLERLIDDSELLVNVLWSLCRRQAAGMTSVAFGEGLVGVLDDARDAIFEAIREFFPTPEQLAAIKSEDEDDGSEPISDTPFDWGAFCLYLAGFCGVDPSGLTARELWTMWRGKLETMRMGFIAQACLVWGCDQIDLAEFIRTGSLGERQKRGLDPELRAAVDAKIDEYMTTGKLIIEGPAA